MIKQLTLAGLLLSAGCAGQQVQPSQETPKKKILFDMNGNVVTGDVKIEVSQAKVTDQSNPYDIISGNAKPQPKEQPKETPKETPKPLEQLKEPKYVPVTVKASYSFEKDGFGAGTFYGIIKNYDMSKDKGKILDLVLNAEQAPRDGIFSDKEMADYVTRNKLTVSWVRNAPVAFEIEEKYEVEESQASYFSAFAKNNPARVMYILDSIAAKKVDKQMVKTLEEKILK